MAGLTSPTSRSTSGPPRQSQAVVLTSRAWGHEGGNDITAEFVQPGRRRLAALGDADRQRPSCQPRHGRGGRAHQHRRPGGRGDQRQPGAAAKLVAQTYRGNAGAGIMQPRTKGNLSDFLTHDRTNAHVQRGPFEYSVMRIGKNRPATAPTGIHGRGRRVPLLPAARPRVGDAADVPRDRGAAAPQLRDRQDDAEARRQPRHLHPPVVEPGRRALLDAQLRLPAAQTMTNWCVIGGLETDDPNAANFWTPRPNPLPGTARTRTTTPRLAERLGRRHEPEQHVRDALRRLHRRVDVVHQRRRTPARARPPSRRSRTSSGSRTRSRTSSSRTTSTASAATSCGRRARTCRTAARAQAVHANIGVEKYFFEAGDQILNRIKDVRNTAILPERTGPIADVLYSAAGNSADEHWYNRGVIAYSFETGPTASSTRRCPSPRPPARPAIRVGEPEPLHAAATDRRSTPGTAERGDPDGRSRCRREPAEPAPERVPRPSRSRSRTRPARSCAGGPHSSRASASSRHYDDRGQVRGARVRGRQLRPARVGVRVREGRQAAAEGDHDRRPRRRATPITTTFQFVNEPSVIRYTTDGSKPTDDVDALGLDRAA